MQDNFYKIIEYEFKNKELIDTALTHKSIHNDLGSKYHDYERLEFIGDALLDAVIGIELYHRLPKASEGELTKKRAIIVCEQSISIVAKRLSIGENMSFGHQAIIDDISKRDSVLSDCVEAIIGAIYLDSSYDEASKFIIKNFSSIIDDAINNVIFSDYKSELQEYFQKLTKDLDLRYIVEKEVGPDHDKTFYMHVERNNKILGSGVGKTKKEAEQNAAKECLSRLRKDNK